MDRAWQNNLTHRTELVFGTETVRKIESLNIAVIGVGGVGGWCAEALVRSGVTRMTIVDSDIVCATNVRGRHIAAFDAMLDDGNPGTGSLRAKPSSPVSVAASGINENALYVVCMGF